MRSSAMLALALAAAGCGDPVPAMGVVDAGVHDAAPAADVAEAGVCTEGARACEGDTPTVCAAGAWAKTPTCAADMACRAGLCEPRSCATKATGTDDNCGDHRDCCGASLVPGGTFLRGFDGVEAFDTGHPATISAFLLDDFPVTIGRFRAFVASGNGVQSSPPATGSGGSPHAPGSGWQPLWQLFLAADTQALAGGVSCAGLDHLPPGHDADPVGCVTWTIAFAFCAWDGGRLPTEAELMFAESGGDEQRYYPWSSPPTSTAVTADDAVFWPSAVLAPVGKQSVAGRWGQLDLGGNVWAWVLDRYAAEWPVPCVDCVSLSPTADRMRRGGGFRDTATTMRAARRSLYSPYNGGDAGVGIRCARDLPVPSGP